MTEVGGPCKYCKHYYHYTGYADRSERHFCKVEEYYVLDPIYGNIKMHKNYDCYDKNVDYLCKDWTPTLWYRFLQLFKRKGK